MVKQIWRRRMRALVAGSVAMAMVVTACGSDSADSGSDSAAGAPHTSHGASSSPAPPPEPLRDGERFVELNMAKPYTPSAPNGGTDEYRCLLIDPKLTKPAFLTGTQFQPQNVPIVHHALVQVVPPEAAALARAKDAETPGDGWTCFGGNGLGEGRALWVDTWTPNGTETVLNHDVGFPMKPGSLVLLQVHYNLLATDGRAESDQSGVRLRMTGGTANTIPLRTLPLQAPIELPCASGESGPLCDRDAAVADVTKRFGAEAGGKTVQKLLDVCTNGEPVPGDTQQCDYPVQQPTTVYAALGHMHVLGRSIKVEINPGTAQARTLMDVPNFNFDDQKFEVMSTPVELKRGDTLRITCTHDASLRQKLPQLSDLPPRYVVWGDGTSDEMCISLLTVSATK